MIRVGYNMNMGNKSLFLDVKVKHIIVLGKSMMKLHAKPRHWYTLMVWIAIIDMLQLWR